MDGFSSRRIISSDQSCFESNFLLPSSKHSLTIIHLIWLPSSSINTLSTFLLLYPRSQSRLVLLPTPTTPSRLFNIERSPSTLKQENVSYTSLNSKQLPHTPSQPPQWLTQDKAGTLSTEQIKDHHHQE